MDQQTSKLLEFRGLSPIRKVPKGLSLRQGCSPPNKFTINERRHKQIHSPRWKQMIHPEIESKYNDLMANFSDVRGTAENLQDAKSIAWQKSLLDKLQLSIDQKFESKNQASRIEQQKKQEPGVVIKQKSQASKQEESTFEDCKGFYESKINVLEHQNSNLREQLFYLREAIMKVYEKE